jgi:hypothetical protein
MSQFYHVVCNKTLVEAVRLELIMLTLGVSEDGITFSPGAMDIRFKDQEGKLKRMDEGCQANPSFFCRACNKEVPMEEVLCDCYGCNEKHPIKEMVNTIHTSPVKMVPCYTEYRASHPDEMLPERPKTLS